MSLNYVFSNNTVLISKVKHQGYDIEALVLTSRDFKVLTKDLNLTTLQTFEFTRALKQIHDRVNSRAVLDDSDDIPNRITIHSKGSNLTFFFTFNMVKSGEHYYFCDICSKSFNKSQLKMHVVEHDID